MTDEPQILYISTDISGLTPRFRAEAHPHMGADEWVPREMLGALRAVLEEAAEALQECAGHISEYENVLSDYRRQWAWPKKLATQIRAALAALPAPPGDQGEGE